MAEPLFIVADIDLSAPALRRWLKSAPQSVAAFDDWPESVRLGAPGLTELAPPVEPSVADALVSYCVDSFGREDGHLHCRHDYRIGDTRIASNARGHLRRGEADGFDGLRTIQVFAPA